MPLHVAFIQPKGELVNVPAKMLWADMMEGAIDAALENGDTPGYNFDRDAGLAVNAGAP
jgi:hypothetical protein